MTDDSTSERPKSIPSETTESLGMLYARVKRLTPLERAALLVAFSERSEMTDNSRQIAAVFGALEDVWRAVARENGELDG